MNQARAEDTAAENTSTTTTTHRVLAATLAATALQANCPCVTKAFAAHRIIGLAIQNSLLLPSCSVIHAKTLAMARIALSDECLLSRETGDSVESPPPLWKDVWNARGDGPRCMDTVVSIILDVCGEDREDNLPLKRGRPEADDAQGGQGANAHLIVGFCIALCGMLFDLVYDSNESNDSNESSDSDDVVVFQGSDDDSKSDDAPTNEGPGTEEERVPTNPSNPSKDPSGSLTSSQRDEVVLEVRTALEQNAAWNRLVESKVLETARAIQRQPLGGDVPEKLSMYSNDLGDLGDLGAGPLMALLQSQLGGMTFSNLSGS